MKRQCIALLLVAIMAVSTLTAVGVTTASKTDAATPNYSSSLNNFFLKAGGKLVTPFKKTRVYDREAYVGAESENGFTYHIILFPMTSYKDALSYRGQLINSYKAQGFRQYKIDNSNPAWPIWVGTMGNTAVGVAGGACKPFDNRPATMVITS